MPATFSITARVSLLSRLPAQFASGATAAASSPLRSVSTSSRSDQGTPFFVLDRAVAQHQMRKIDIELVRRHVWALGHEAHVAQGAGVDHLLVIGGATPSSSPLSELSIRSNSRGKASQRLKQRRQP